MAFGCALEEGIKELGSDSHGWNILSELSLHTRHSDSRTWLPRFLSLMMRSVLPSPQKRQARPRNTPKTRNPQRVQGADCSPNRGNRRGSGHLPDAIEPARQSWGNMIGQGDDAAGAGEVVVGGRPGTGGDRVPAFDGGRCNDALGFQIGRAHV